MGAPPYRVLTSSTSLPGTSAARTVVATCARRQHTRCRHTRGQRVDPNQNAPLSRTRGRGYHNNRPHCNDTALAIRKRQRGGVVAGLRPRTRPSCPVGRMPCPSPCKSTPSDASNLNVLKIRGPGQAQHMIPRSADSLPLTRSILSISATVTLYCPSGCRRVTIPASISISLLLLL